MTRVIDVNDEGGAVIAPEWLTRAEVVHRQLRPHLPVDYTATMARVFRDGGRMAVAVREQAVVGVAVHRIYENTADGHMMYVDDLVTDDRVRSSGVGKVLMEHLQNVARRAGCQTYKLDSGTHRQQAHKFYFRERMTIVAFHFKKSLA